MTSSAEGASAAPAGQRTSRPRRSVLKRPFELPVPSAVVRWAGGSDVGRARVSAFRFRVRLRVFVFQWGERGREDGKHEADPPVPVVHQSAVPGALSGGDGVLRGAGHSGKQVFLSLARLLAGCWLIWGSLPPGGFYRSPRKSFVTLVVLADDPKQHLPALRHWAGGEG